MTDKEVHEFVIEKDVPIPASIKTSWPFKNMQIGDAVRFDTGPLFRRAANAAYAYAAHKKDYGVKFKIKWFPSESDPHDEMKGYGRIWRIT